MDNAEQSVSWTLPRDLVDRLKLYQDQHGLASQSEAAGQILTAELGDRPLPSNERHPVEATL
jgi:hypothetical protein